MENKRYKSLDNYVINNVAGNPILVPVSSSVAQLDDLLLFNESAIEIVEMMQKGLSVNEIANTLESECDDAPPHETIVREVTELAAKLVACGYFAEQ